MRVIVRRPGHRTQPVARLMKRVDEVYPSKRGDEVYDYVSTRVGSGTYSPTLTATLQRLRLLEFLHRKSAKVHPLCVAERARLERETSHTPGHSL